MQIYHLHDAVNEADRLTPHNYLYQLERRRHEDDWLNMKPHGQALLRLTAPVHFSYKVKCQILGGLKPDSLKDLLKTWTTLINRSAMGYLQRMHVAASPASTMKNGSQITQKVDNLIHQLNQQLNIGPEASSSSGIWNSVNATHKKTRMGPLVASLGGLASALEAAEMIVAETTLFGVVYETAMDAIADMKVTREFIQLLTKIVVDPQQVVEMPPTPGSQNDGLGEPRYFTSGSTLSLTAEQHARLGHDTQNLGGVEEPHESGSSQKRRKLGS